MEIESPNGIRRLHQNDGARRYRKGRPASQNCGERQIEEKECLQSHIESQF